MRTKLPTAAQELADRARRRRVRGLHSFLRDKTRPQEVNLVFEENCNYGFRATYGLKPWARVTIIALLPRTWSSLSRESCGARSRRC